MLLLRDVQKFLFQNSPTERCLTCPEADGWLDQQNAKASDLRNCPLMDKRLKGGAQNKRTEFSWSTGGV